MQTATFLPYFPLFSLSPASALVHCQINLDGMTIVRSSAIAWVELGLSAKRIETQKCIETIAHQERQSIALLQTNQNIFY